MKKKIIAAILAIAIVASSVIVPANAVNKYDGVYKRSNTWVMTDTNNLRKSKSTSSAILGTVKKNTSVVDTLNDGGSWIQPYGYTGFIHKNYAIRDVVAAYYFGVVNHDTPIYMNSRLVDPVQSASLKMNDAVWVISEPFVNSNRVWVCPIKTQIGTKTIYGFVKMDYVYEACNYICKIKKATVFYNDPHMVSYRKIVSSGSYWVVDFDGDMVEIAYKDGNRMASAWVLKSGCVFSPVPVF